MASRACRVGGKKMQVEVADIFAQAHGIKDRNINWGNTDRLGTGSLPFISRHCAVLAMQHVSKR